MAVMRLENIANTLKQLEEKGRTGVYDLMAYFGSPFVMSLGYEVLDLNKTETDWENGTITVDIDERLKLVFSLNGQFPKNEYERMFLVADVYDQKFELYFKVLGKWEKVTTVSISNVDTQSYMAMTKYAARDHVVPAFKEKGERLLTEGVINKKLEDGEVYNDFLVQAVLSELSNPSDDMVKLLANRLVSDYTTKDAEWVKGKIQGIKEDGLHSVVSDLVSIGEIDGVHKGNNDVEINIEYDDQIDDNPEEQDDEDITADIASEFSLKPNIEANIVDDSELHNNGDLRLGAIDDNDEEDDLPVNEYHGDSGNRDMFSHNGNLNLDESDINLNIDEENSNEYKPKEVVLVDDDSGSNTDAGALNLEDVLKR
ncbi:MULTISPECIES: hypothetical protein [Bacillus amyloliquefaciens group]|uniref:hypothetical protein n=1 Tax=Bacillus amyloliquefaciens group TaxID=1938374 RepID=UPI00073CC0A7|nr:MULTISPECIES: hypothetical protein [Bacillus amyloliquefaciens group]KTF59099.1 hypothetical protein AR691_17605 [Bacillus amyloliquefaciens]